MPRQQKQNKPAPETIRLTYTGEVVPAVRMTTRGKWLPRAQEYLAAKTAIGFAFAEQMRGRDPLPRVPLRVKIEIADARGHVCDVDNLAKTLLDAANGIVYRDDRWVDELHIVRRLLKAPDDKPRPPSEVVMEVNTV